MVRNLAKLFSTKQKQYIKNLLNYPVPYDFKMSNSVARQSLEMSLPNGGSATVDAPGNIPLYETIYEVVDDDCYGLKYVLDQGIKFDHIFDIGCNVGIFSLVANSYFPESNITAFEPVSINYQFASKNLKTLIKAQQLVLKQNALGTQEKHEYITIGELGVDSSTQRKPGLEDKIEQVNVISFRHLLSGYSGTKSMIKIDIEGAEYAIFESLKKEDLKDVNFISLELHDIGVTNAMKSFKSKLHSLGYKFLVKPDSWGRSGLEQLWARKDDC